MNWNLFLHIIVWVIAVISTLLVIIGAAASYWRNFTKAGRLDAALDAFKGRAYSFRWSTVGWMIVAWIAVFCLN